MPVVAAPNIDVGPFNNLQPYLYWGCGANSIQENCSIIPASSSNGVFPLATALRARIFLRTNYTSLPILLVLPIEVQQREHVRACKA